MKTDPFASEADYSGIHLFNTSGSPLPLDRDKVYEIADSIEEYDDCSFNLVEIAFVDTDKILAINREHLNHNYVTDIITFRYDKDDSNQSVEGTLYCCASRIQEQAAEYDQPQEEEFKRVIIHGLLHLIGYDDRSESSQKEMRKREDFYLKKLR